MGNQTNKDIPKEDRREIMLPNGQLHVFSVRHEYNYHGYYTVLETYEPRSFGFYFTYETYEYFAGKYKSDKRTTKTDYGNAGLNHSNILAIVSALEKKYKKEPKIDMKTDEAIENLERDIHSLIDKHPKIVEYHKKIFDDDLLKFQEEIRLQIKEREFLAKLNSETTDTVEGA